MCVLDPIFQLTTSPADDTASHSHRRSVSKAFRVCESSGNLVIWLYVVFHVVLLFVIPPLFLRLSKLSVGFRPMYSV